jgi:hypothetical protein
MLKIQYISHGKLESLNSEKKINYLLTILRSGDIVLLDTKLSSKDEALLIRETMNSIDETFNGIEIGVLGDNTTKTLMSKIRSWLSEKLVGKISGLTLIGPAKIISELRQHPETLELHFSKDYLRKNIKKNKNIESNK